MIKTRTLSIGLLLLFGLSVLIWGELPQRLASAAQAPSRLHNSPVKPGAISDDAFWDDRFVGPPGAIGNEVNALAAEGSDIYVGGVFLTVGNIMSKTNVSVNRIAKWNGSAWSALGDGLNGQVNAIVISGTDLYVGGNFTMAGGTSANYVARWDGSSWSALGAGTDGMVNAIAINGNSVYVGGNFTTAGGLNANRVAKWDGSSWTALGSGMNLAVRALAFSGGALYAGGDFSTADNAEARYIARWDGNAWSPLLSGGHNGLPGPVYALAANGNNLYVGGSFDQAGGTTVNNIAVWDGSGWSALGDGVTLAGLASVNTILLNGSAGLYAGGWFSTAGGVSATNIAHWNGSAWSALGAGILDCNCDYPPVLALAMGGGKVYGGGLFERAGGIGALNIAEWDGTNWSALGTGDRSVNGDYYASVSAIGTSWSQATEVHPSLLEDPVVGGSFTTINGASANNVAVWHYSTGTWSAMTGIPYPVTSIWRLGRAYAGTEVNVYEWTGNGANWRALNLGGNGPVYAVSPGIAGDGNNIYVGGGFNLVTTMTAPYIVAWNVGCSCWQVPGDGANGAVHAIAQSHWLTITAGLFVGGDFTSISPLAVGTGKPNYIAQWDYASKTWSSLGNGVNGTVYAIKGFPDHVLVGGAFSSATNPDGTIVSVNNIASWNPISRTWSALGAGVNNGVNNNVMAIDGRDVVYVGGHFTTAGGVNANHIARWDSVAWSPLGSGVDDDVKAIAIDGPDVFVGGDFRTAGGHPSWRFAHWAPRYDVTGDGIMTVLDLQTIAAAIGTNNPAYDLNGNGVVDAGDLTLAAATWHAP